MSLKKYVYFYKKNYLKDYGDWVIPEWDMSRFKGKTSKELEYLAEIYNSRQVKNIYNQMAYKKALPHISQNWINIVKKACEKTLSKEMPNISAITLYTDKSTKETKQNTTGGRLDQTLKAIKKEMDIIGKNLNKNNTILLGIYKRLVNYRKQLENLQKHIDSNKKTTGKKSIVVDTKMLQSSGIVFSNYRDYMNQVITFTNLILVGLNQPVQADEGWVFENLAPEITKSKIGVINKGKENISIAMGKFVGGNKSGTTYQQSQVWLKEIDKNRKYYDKTVKYWKKESEKGSVSFQTSRKSYDTLDNVITVDINDSDTGKIIKSISYNASLKNVSDMGNISLFKEAPLDTLLELQADIFEHFLSIWSNSNGNGRRETIPGEIKSSRKKIKTILLPYIFSLRGLSGQKHGAGLATLDTLLVKDKSNNGLVKAYSMYDIAERIRLNPSIISFNEIPEIQNTWVKNNNMSTREAAITRSVNTYLKLHNIKISATLNLNKIKI